MTSELLTGAWVAVLVATLSALALPPSLYLERGGEDGDYDPTHGLGDVPVDDPMRSPDWCHAHGEIEKED